MTPPTAEERARLRELAETYLRTGTFVDDGKFIDAMTQEKCLALLDALDTAERERDEWRDTSREWQEKHGRRSDEIVEEREASRARIAALEAEVAAAKERIAWRGLWLSSRRVVRASSRTVEERNRNQAQTIAEQGAALYEAETVLIERDRARADLARVTGELAEAKKRLSDEGDRRIAERSAALDDHVRIVTERDNLKRDREKLAAELANVKADNLRAFLEGGREPTRERDEHRAALNRIADRLHVVHEDPKIEAAVAELLRDREKLQGERDAARKVAAYAEHFASCPCAVITLRPTAPCTCGLAAARREAGLT